MKSTLDHFLLGIGQIGLALPVFNKRLSETMLGSRTNQQGPQGLIPRHGARKVQSPLPPPKQLSVLVPLLPSAHPQTGKTIKAENKT